MEADRSVRMRRADRHAGVTLIELMITVAVVALLAAVAYPSYVEQVRKSKRTDARTALLQASQQLERCYTRNQRFDTCALTLPFTTPQGTYQISNGGTAFTTTTFRLVATPQGSQTADTKCGSFSITDTNLRAVTGSGGRQECGW
jgi:type IV pilus assembly protein PilE